MENRFKKFIVVLWTLILAAALFVVPTAADSGGTARLTASYQDKPVAGIELKLYYCAELYDSGCVFVGDFKDSPLASMPKSVDEWNTLAVGFEGVVSQNGTTPDAVMSSDQNGVVTFTSLKPGIYYIPGAVLKTADMVYATQPFFFSITNTNTTVEAKLKITGEPASDDTYRRVLKVWNDGGDTKSRPESIKVILYQNGVEYDTVELSKDNNWSYDWVLPSGYNWTVNEIRPDGYTYVIDRVGNTFTITNTPIPDKTPVVRNVIKIWNDNGDTASRPESIKVILYQNDTAYETVELNEENNWRYSWVLPDGYNWNVREIVPDGYTSETTVTGDIFRITNTPAPSDNHIVRNVHKIWNDNGDTQSRPESIKIILYRNGAQYETVELSKDNDWRYSWILPEGYDWSVAEAVPAGYTSTTSFSGNTYEIVNTPNTDDDHIVRNVRKVWNDAGKEASRPETIKVILYQNNQEYDTVLLSELNDWRWSWVLPVGYDWDVREAVPSGYTSSTTFAGSTFTIVNTPNPSDNHIVRSVVKIWNDNGDTSSRPESIKVILCQNGTEYDTVELSEKNDWRCSWVLPEGYDWTVKEAVPSGYTSGTSFDGTTFEIVNTPDNPGDDHIVRNVRKVWNDAGNEAKRPESIKVILYRNSTEYETVALSEANGWRYSWILPVGYDWEVREIVPSGYTSGTTFDGTTFEIVNTPDNPGDDHIIRNVVKIWNDNGNAASRPESISVTLYRDGTEYETAALSEKNDWRYSWVLPAGYDWTVKETVPGGYTSASEFDGTTFEITNTPTPSDDHIVRNVRKIWNDNGNEASRPESITVTLYQNGTAYDTVELSEKNGWRCSWTLPEGYEWTVKEDVPNGYTSAATFEGETFEITNTPNPSVNNIVRNVRKVWNDNGNEASRPESITVTLYQNGTAYDTIALSEKNDWHYSWVLPEGYDWTVKEDVPNGYTSETTFEGETFEIVNTPTPSDNHIVRNVHKVWNDAGNEAERPESIKVTLYRNGGEYETVELSEKNGWRYSWILPEGYEWTVTEAVPDGYTSATTFDGTTFEIVNTPNPKENNIVRSVHKIWNDNGDAASRPESITVTLYQNGEAYETVELSEKNDWRYSWVLPEGSEWTVAEAVPAGYTSCTTLEGTVFEIVNTPNPPEGKIVRNVRKVWNDNGDTASRPESVTVILYQNGTEYDTAALSEKNNWRYSWELPEGYDWSVKECTPDGYLCDIVFEGDTFTVTNTKTPTPPPPDTPPTPDNPPPPPPDTPPTPYNPPHLPQTGLIWWPIIAFWGVAVLAFAIAFRFRHKNNNEKE